MYKHILVPLDGSELAECVLPHVDSIAKGCRTEQVTFIRVAEPFLEQHSDDINLTDVDEKRFVAVIEENARKYFEQLVKRLDYGKVEIETAILPGIAAETVVEYANNNLVDLITMSTHGRSGVSRWARGSVADKILHLACIPVFMVRAPGCIPGI